MSQDQETGRRVGDRLRQAREQKGITVAEAGARLHILSSYINAMENGRYGVLPGTVFLRGYVRSYARLLELNEDEVVGQLDRELGTTKEETTKAIEEKPVAVKRKQSPHRWLLLIAVLLLLAGGVLQYQHLQAPSDETVEGGDAPSDDVRDEASEPEATSSEPMPWTDAEDDTPVSRSAPYTDESAAEEEEPLPEASESPESPAAPGGAPNEAAPADMTREQTSEAEPTPAESVPAEPAINATSPATPEPAPATPGVDRLDVTFSGECWFEVEDANGKRRRGLFEAGDRLVFQGRAPFTVVVGAASETQMVFNGVAVDYARYSVWNNRVGMTLGQ